MGRVVGIWVKRSHGGVMDAREAADLVAGRGLAGDATRGGRRQVTILSAERWRALTAALPGPLDPVIRRANLLVEGIDIEQCRGKVLAIGDARVRILGETRPCDQMDDACRGLQSALSVPWGGGAFGEVLDGGPIQVGSNVDWDEADARAGITGRTRPSAATS